jgi:hypothetical protein
MISTTPNPRALRLVLEGTHEETTGRADIVCTMEATEAGIKIVYLGHQFWIRSNRNGAWQRGEFRTLPMTSALRSQISTGAMLEFWEMFCHPEVASAKEGR